MSKAPEVSVVMVTYNRPDYLRRTLRSVLSQCSVDFEVELVDNGSTESVEGIVREFGDDRVRFHRNDANQHPGAVRNEAVFRAEGDWIAYVDDDDLWGPNKLREQVDACVREGTTWGYCGIVDIDEHDAVIRGEPPMAPADVAAALPYRCEVPGGQSGLIAKRDALVALGGQDPSYLYVDDWELYLRLLRDHGIPTCVSRPLVAYRLHHGQLSNSPDAFLGEVAAMNAAHADMRGAIGRRNEPGALDRSFILRGMAEGALRGGDRVGAAKGFVAAARAGDRRSRVLLATVLLPDRVQRALRLRRADQAWLAEAQTWLTALAD